MDMKTTPLPEKIAGLRINGQRLWDSLMELAQIGATPKGGVCRLTLTDLDKQGRDLVLGWAKDAGMTITIDKIGNGFTAIGDGKALALLHLPQQFRELRFCLIRTDFCFHILYP